jgi:chromosome segregation ATPase
MARLLRLERDVSEIKQVLAGHGQMLTEHGQMLTEHGQMLTEHGQRLDRVEAAIHQVHRGLSDRMDNLEHRLGSRMDSLEHRLGGRMDSLEQSLGSRLDRLLAVTLEERTRNYERLTDIERRLSKLEGRDG